MDLFHRIDDAECITRSRGVMKQAELYRRGNRIYVKASGGYVRIVAPFNGTWGTSVPNLNVVEMPIDIDGLSVDSKSEPKWVGK
jgi:hypothetical protein